MDEKKENHLEIEIDENTAQGIYCNLAMLTHSETEFILDFIFAQPQNPKARVRSRIITSPAHLKKLLAALQDNIQKYEQRFGPIESKTSNANEPKIGFYH